MKLVDDVKAVDPNRKNDVVTRIEPVITKARKVALAKAAIEFNEDVQLYLNEQMTVLTEQERVSAMQMLIEIKKQNDEIFRYIKRLLKGR